MRKLTLALLAALPVAALVTIAAQSPAAQARSVANLSPDQIVDASELIARGTVSEVWTEKDAAGAVWTLASVELTRVYKGDLDTRSVIVHQRGGSENGTGVTMSVYTRFSPGEQALLYLDMSQSGVLLVETSANSPCASTQTTAGRFSSEPPWVRSGTTTTASFPILPKTNGSTWATSNSKSKLG